jgi:spore maturation protein CgeB
MGFDSAAVYAPRILYVGDLVSGGTCAQRLRALRDLGVAVTPVDTEQTAHRRRDRTWWQRIRRRCIGPYDWAGANQRVIERVQSEAFDIVWVDRGVTIEAATLRCVREWQPCCRIIGYSPDDMQARHNQSPQFRRHLPLYDLYLTTKSYGVDELRAMGCPQVVFCANAFDPHTHRPVSVTPEVRRRYGGAVGFVGTWERDRACSLLHLARAGIAVRVWGDGWQRVRKRHDNLTIEGRALYNDEYAAALSAFDINLCFLRKVNRDLQTTRSVEIPACGAFMLAERTAEHLALFTEEREAAYFGSDDELLTKVEHYLAHPEQRRRVAAAGRARCVRDGYSYATRLAQALALAGIDCVPERTVSEGMDFRCASPS